MMLLFLRIILYEYYNTINTIRYCNQFQSKLYFIHNYLNIFGKIQKLQFQSDFVNQLLLFLL